MKVEIWSDIMCPFCYIGKRRFENALEQFPNKENIEIQWRSFQLAPELKTDTSKSVHEYLAEKKGWSLDYSEDVNNKMTATAKEAGLEYNFDKAIVANSFNAHRLSHLATKYNLQDAAEERLFAAYFTEGKNIDNNETLIQLGNEIGLPETEIRKMLDSDLYANEVQQDIYLAQKIGVRGVPFFVLDNKYAVSGAQTIETFIGALEKAWEESFNKTKSVSLNDSENSSCSADGNC
ncbi:MAG TPA: disulfide bond formation protein DsbA [Sphingobacteriaceae bacterium]|nr:disulfide bond formation protein DsbA [Sphingobacteriaceae bacterium]